MIDQPIFSNKVLELMSGCVKPDRTISLRGIVAQVDELDLLLSLLRPHVSTIGLHPVMERFEAVWN